MKIYKISKSKYTQAFAFGLFAFFVFGQVAHASVCYATFNDGTECSINYYVPAKIDNAAYGHSRVSCNRVSARISVTITLQHKTPIGAWNSVTSDSTTAYQNAVVDTSAGCRYGSAHSWRTRTEVSVNNQYVGQAQYSPAATLSCDI